jgi:hypothetical protein
VAQFIYDWKVSVRATNRVLYSERPVYVHLRGFGSESYRTLWRRYCGPETTSGSQSRGAFGIGESIRLDEAVQKIKRLCKGTETKR